MLTGMFQVLFIMVGKFYKALFKLLRTKKKTLIKGIIVEADQECSYNDNGKQDGRVDKYVINVTDENGEVKTYEYIENNDKKAKQLFQEGDTVEFCLFNPSDKEIIIPLALKKDIKHYGLMQLIIVGSIILLLVLFVVISMILGK